MNKEWEIPEQEIISKEGGGKRDPEGRMRVACGT